MPARPKVRNIVVVGASTGGLDAVSTVLRTLPSKLPASIFIVLHTSPQGPGLLSGILERISALPIETPRDRQVILQGRVYLAPPDYHLLLAPGQMRLNHGPREHRFRPAIDPLFRSAALYYGPRVIGVVLTGNLADGSYGLRTIKRAGGLAIVQDPAEAVAPSMPSAALAHTQADYVLPVGR